MSIKQTSRHTNKDKHFIKLRRDIWSIPTLTVVPLFNISKIYEVSPSIAMVAFCSIIFWGKKQHRTYALQSSIHIFHYVIRTKITDSQRHIQDWIFEILKKLRNLSKWFSLFPFLIAYLLIPLSTLSKLPLILVFISIINELLPCL